MHTSFVSVVVKDHFWLLTIFLLLKVASVFNMLINAAFMCFPTADIWEVPGIHHNNNDMFAERAIWEARLSYMLVPSVLRKLRFKDCPFSPNNYPPQGQFYTLHIFSFLLQPAQTFNKNSDHIPHYNTHSWGWNEALWKKGLFLFQK